MIKDIDAAAILDLRMGPNNASATTVREYLVALAREVWRKREDFSGKRPFGNSGWHHEIYEALAVAEVIESMVDEDGYRDISSEEADRADLIILKALEAMERVTPDTGEATR